MKGPTRDEGSRTVIGLLRPLTMSRRYCGLRLRRCWMLMLSTWAICSQMKVFVDNHGIGLNRQFGHHRTDVVVAIVVHDVVGCDEGWHISACLLGEVGIDVPVIGRTFGAVDGLVDLVGATVVGSDDQGSSRRKSYRGRSDSGRQHKRISLGRDAHR